MKRDKQLRQGIRRILSRNDSYAAESYVFVQKAVHFTHKVKVRGGQCREIHVSCHELLDGIRRYALQEYGPLSASVLGSWGVRSTDDFGKIVFLMAEEGLLGVSEQDTAEQFCGVFDFTEAFVRPFQPLGREISLPILD